MKGLFASSTTSGMSEEKEQAPTRNGTRSAAQPVNVLPLPMQFMRPFAGLYCQECGATACRLDDTTEQDDALLKEYDELLQCFPTSSAVSPVVMAPMKHASSTSCMNIIGEYIAACQFYGCGDRINAGVLTTLRYSLPSLRVTGDFHDADMLALAETMVRHGKYALRYIQRLDFGLASNEGKLHGKRGFRSHGALALAKILQACPQIQDVRVSRHKIGPFGASAIFLAASSHPSLRLLEMRRCRIMERGGFAFSEQLLSASPKHKLEHVDLGSNRIGLRGCIVIEQALSRRKSTDLVVDLEGNLVFQEVSSVLFLLRTL